MGFREMLKARGERRRRIFKSLVAEQDRLAAASGKMNEELVRLSQRTIVDTFCLGYDEFHRIKEEGIRRNWLDELVDATHPDMTG